MLQQQPVLTIAQLPLLHVTLVLIQLATVVKLVQQENI